MMYQDLIEHQQLKYYAIESDKMNKLESSDSNDSKRDV